MAQTRSGGGSRGAAATRPKAAAERTAPALPARYTFVRWLGEGGSARVLLVRDAAGAPTEKALKILNSRVAPELLAGFASEFRILASLDHPGLARVFEFGSLPDGRSYYSADFIDGPALGDAGDLDLRAICEAMAAVCRALAYVHCRGYVHNDVKPSNIILPGAAPAAARLLDFGLAGLDRADARTVAGTPGYIAPERLVGRGGWDGRADLFSVGATLYRLLTGKPPVSNPEPARALAALRRGFPSLAEARADVPAPLARIVDRLLALDPAQRPRRPEEVIVALGEAIGVGLPLETPGAEHCYALSSVLLGRSDEIERAREAMAAAERGGGCRIVAIGGGPGLGKSRLAREICVAAETEGWRVATATCVPGAPAVAPIASLAAQLGAAPSPEPADAPPRPGADAARVLGGALAPRTMLAMDDAHLAGDLAWNAMFALPGRPRGAATVVLMSLDPESLTGPRRQRLALAEATGDLARLDLAPLSAEASGRMIDSLFGADVMPDRMRAAIVRAAAGSPLLLEEMARELVETGALASTPKGFAAIGQQRAAPPTARLDESLRRRCRPLDLPSRDTLMALAALGQPASTTAIAAVIGGSVDVPLALADLSHRGLVSMAEGGAALAQRALASVVFDGVDDDRRRALHRAAAAWLAENGADDATLARACRQAGDLVAARTHAERAGQQALAIGEGVLSCTWLGEAIACARALAAPAGELSDLLADLGEALNLAGRYPDAVAALAEARELIGPPRAARRRYLAAVAASVALRMSDVAGAETWIARAEADADTDAGTSDRAASAQIAYARAVLAVMRRDFAEAGAEFGRVIALLGHPEPPAEVRTLLARALTGRGYADLRFDLAAARPHLAEAVRVAERTGNRHLLAIALHNHSSGEALAGNLDRADALIGQAVDLADASGAMGLLQSSLVAEAVIATARGDWDRSRTVGARAAAVAAALRAQVGETASELAFCAWFQDDASLAETESRHAIDRDAHENLISALMVAAYAAAERGDRAAATALTPSIDAAARDPSSFESGLAAAARAYALAPADDAADDAVRGASAALTADALGDAIAAVTAGGYRIFLPPLHRDHARWLARSGRLDAAHAALARAVALLVEFDAKPALLRLDQIAATLAHERPPTPPDARATDAATKKPTPTGRHATRPRETTRTDAETRRMPRSATESRVRGVTESRVRGATESRLLELTIGPIETARGIPGVVGSGAAIARALDLLDKLAGNDVPVLLSGETGTGKDVFARALHAAGPRADGPFVVVNCAALPPSLFEAELFGYRKGAFTGAVRDHDGLVRQAHGGTLFLDEIGDLPLPLQPRLLRVLEERAVRPVGGTQESPVDFRLVAASHHDLGREVDQGRFRADLYYRLNGAELRLPPLRERLEDLPALCRHLLDRTAARGESAARITRGALKLLCSYTWPGNVRELENELARAALLADGRPIRPDDFSPRLKQKAGRDTPVVFTRGTWQERLDAFQRQVLRDEMARQGGSQVKTASVLGVTRQGLRVSLIRLGLMKGPRGRSTRRRAPKK